MIAHLVWWAEASVASLRHRALTSLLACVHCADKSRLARPIETDQKLKALVKALRDVQDPVCRALHQWRVQLLPCARLGQCADKRACFPRT